ncbi:MAG: mechanosensitive ion channel [Oscillospiraceae bacterium]|nr:mechanosensitive ion channel [Oscillospiraceae bacterium]
MKEILTLAAESGAPEIAEEAAHMAEAVARGNVSKTMLQNFGDTLVGFLPTVIFAVILYIVGKIAVKIAVKLIDKAMGRTRIEETARGFLMSLLNITLSAFVIVIALSALGIPMTSIVTVIGTAGVAIGLALQNSLSNVAGGFIILFTKPFSKGDYIIASGIEGIVEEIKILSTALKTNDNKVIFIPNGMVAGGTITNFSREEKRRVDLTFGISYESDFKAAIETVKEVIGAHELILQDEGCFVRVSELAESAVIITARVWTKTADYWTVHFDLIEQVKTAFDEKGIEIPYSKLDVNIKSDT